MADPSRRRSENVDGPWFVDETCIDCGTCMWMAPEVFREAGGQSAVHRQPDDADAASAALLACPTGSIGGPARRVGFPRQVLPDVWHMGYHDRRSFGAAAYLVRSDAGLVMIDVPRFVRPLVAAVEAMGGLHAIVLTHRDDVAGHAEWAEHFDVPRFIHADDDVVGDQALAGADGRVAGLQWMHVPGHTRGSVTYQWRDVLFTGDHLAGSVADARVLRAFRGACWYDWGAQTTSMRRTAGLDVAHVLPGHGAPWHGDVATFQREMAGLVARMRA